MTSPDGDDGAMTRILGFVERGELVEAETALRARLELAPLDARAWGIAGALAFELGEHALAVERLTRAAELAPTDSVVAGHLAHALLGAGGFDAAAAAYRRALALTGDSAPLLLGCATADRRRGALSEALAGYERLIASGVRQGAVFAGFGAALRDDGRFEEAEAALVEAVDLEPGVAAHRVNLGNAIGDQGRSDEAVAHYEAALELDPTSAEACFDLFAALHDVDRPRADAMLERALELRPDFVAARFHARALATLAGDVDRANALVDGEPEHLGSSLAFVRERIDDARRRGVPSPPRSFTDGFRLLRFALTTASVDGPVVELGVRHGASIRVIAASDPGREVHGFDSFEGLPSAWGELPKGAYSTRGVVPRVPPNVTLHRGWFADTLPAFVAARRSPLRFVHVDCDIHRSAREALDLLAPLIVEGTIVVFDDYLANPHWEEDEHRAWIEVAADRGFSYDYLAFSLFARQAAVRVTGR